MTSTTPTDGVADQPTIAVLGTGKMGSTIARRLAESGYELRLWNRTRSRAEALGIGTVFDTPAAAVAGADVVISSLTGPEAVQTAYLGPDGAVTGAKGTLFIEMSTAGPAYLPALAAAVTAAGGRLVDAPILGAPPFVLEGQAAILVSGDDRDVRRASPILMHFGVVRPVGRLGSAARLKLLANSMLADVVLAAAELQVAGEDVGLDRYDVFWVLQRFAPQLAGRRRGFVEDRHDPALFALRDLRKDLDLALGLFEPSGIRTPMTAEARQLVVAAASRYGDLDITAVARPYRHAESTIDVKSPDAASPAAAPAR